MAIYGDGKHDSGTEVSLQEISLDKVGVIVVVDTEARVGHLKKGFDRGDDIDYETDQLWNMALNTLESLILAHAIEGIDVTSEAYQIGIQTTLDAVSNNL